MIVCRECGETWPAPARRLGADRRGGVADPWRRGGAAADRPLLLDFAEQQSAARIVPDEETPPARRGRALPITAAACLFLAVVVLGREAAVSAIPDLAGLYAAVGLPVNLAGLAIDQVVAERVTGDPLARLVVRGTIRNVSGAEEIVPPILITLGDNGASTPAGMLAPPAPVLGRGESASFTWEIAEPGPPAASVALRFRTATDLTPDAPEAGEP